MAAPFPFPHDTPVHIVADDNFEVAYYARGYLKYKRVRQIASQGWQDTIEQQVDLDEFWLVVACIEKGRVGRCGLV